MHHKCSCGFLLQASSTDNTCCQCCWGKPQQTDAAGAHTKNCISNHWSTMDSILREPMIQWMRTRRGDFSPWTFDFPDHFGVDIGDSTLRRIVRDWEPVVHLRPGASPEARQRLVYTYSAPGCHELCWRPDRSSVLGVFWHDWRCYIGKIQFSFVPIEHSVPATDFDTKTAENCYKARGPAGATGIKLKTIQTCYEEEVPEGRWALGTNPHLDAMEDGCHMYAYATNACVNAQWRHIARAAPNHDVLQVVLYTGWNVGTKQWLKNVDKAAELYTALVSWGRAAPNEKG